MSGEITIHCVPDDHNNEKVFQRVRELGVGTGIVVCPPNVRELYRMPFAVDERGARHFGADGIEGFVGRRLAAAAEGKGGRPGPIRT